jgi:hypothetical protein
MISLKAYPHGHKKESPPSPESFLVAAIRREWLPFLDEFRTFLAQPLEKLPKR